MQAHEAYARDGHVTVRGVVDAATVAAALDHLGGLESALTPEAPASLVTAPIERDGFFTTIAADARLATLAAALLGRPVTAFGCTYVVKPPRNGLPVLWHQDGHPWRTQLGIVDAVTLWVALDESAADNGCLRVIPGSHRGDAQPLRPNTEIANVFGFELDPALVDATRAVEVPLQPGDVSAHHPNLVHGSEANRSSRPRRALALRYRADEASSRTGPGRRAWPRTTRM